MIVIPFACRSSTSEYKEKVKGFLNGVDKSLQKFNQKKLLMQRLSFVIDRLDQNFVSEIDRWMFLALNNGVQQIYFRISTDLKVHLQNLSLQRVNTRENIIQDITNNCPYLKCFALEHFGGLKTIEISKLDKLESVSIVHALPKGLLDSMIGCIYIFLDFLSLRSSKLSFALDCKGLEFLDKNLRACLATGPKTLRLIGCENVERIEIDAPNLSLFNLGTSTIPVLIPKNVSCSVEVEYSSDTERRKVESSLFQKLRKFLGDWPQREYIFVEYVVNNEVTSLGLEATVDCATVIDGLLWSCHPMTISVPPDSSFLNYFIKVLCKTLLDREHPSCCVSSQVKCWRHDLKAVKIESFGGIEDERLLRLDMLLDTLPSLTKYQEVRLNLEWEF
ncbi:hypothetical protein TIFTF001_006492 [Ficus carica]|uniref:Uncharacterized protein n=1 Tax=Ficus carica TaxID=3494 RepID=A0AA87ZN42_FICCA|nr:hypothetical protein TIFTF001_006492 [Ficus carica]